MPLLRQSFHPLYAHFFSCCSLVGKSSIGRAQPVLVHDSCVFDHTVMDSVLQRLIGFMGKNNSAEQNTVGNAVGNEREDSMPTTGESVTSMVAFCPGKSRSISVFLIRRLNCCNCNLITAYIHTISKALPSPSSLPHDALYAWSSLVVDYDTVSATNNCTGSQLMCHV